MTGAVETNEIHGSDPETARILLRIGAVNFRPEDPYKFTSGWASPVYIDCRRLISFVPERRHVIAKAIDVLDERWSASTPSTR